MSFWEGWCLSSILPMNNSFHLKNPPAHPTMQKVNFRVQMWIDIFLTCGRPPTVFSARGLYEGPLGVSPRAWVTYDHGCGSSLIFVKLLFELYGGELKILVKFIICAESVESNGSCLIIWRENRLLVNAPPRDIVIQDPFYFSQIFFGLSWWPRNKGSKISEWIISRKK